MSDYICPTCGGEIRTGTHAQDIAIRGADGRWRHETCHELYEKRRQARRRRKGIKEKPLGGADRGYAQSI